MAKAKSLLEQITDLEEENKRLKKLDKITDLVCENEFGMSRKAIHDLINAANVTKGTTPANTVTSLPENKPVELG